MDFLKNTWYIWVILGLAIFLLGGYGFLNFIGIKGSTCVNSNGITPDIHGIYKNGVCKT